MATQTINSNSLSPSLNKDARILALPLVIVIAVCVAPLLLLLGNISFATPKLQSPLPWPSFTADSQFEEYAFLALKGSFTHTILEWTAVCSAAFVVVLAFMQFRLTREPSLPVIGVALACAGAMDAFHTLAADRLIESVADNRNLIPFTWAICRTFNAVILLVGVGLFALSKTHKVIKKGNAIILVTSTVFIALAYVIIHVCATSRTLPQTMFPNAIITRPYDIYPIIPYMLCACWIFPLYYKRRRTYFGLSLILSVIPQIATQLYMAFGSMELHDSCFNIAHGLKAFSYMVPIFGLSMQNVRTYQQRTSAQKQLRESKMQTAAVIDYAVDAILTIDENGIVETANQATLDMFGYQHHEVIRKNVKMLMPQPYRGEHDDYLSSYKQTGVAKVIGIGREVIGRHKNGSTFAIDLSVSQIMTNGRRLYTGIVRNIEARKQQEKKLTEFKLALDATADCVFMFDPETLKITYTNQSAVEELQYTQEQLLSMTIVDLRPKHTLESFNVMVKPLLENETHTLVFETEHRTSKGIDIPIEVSLRFVPYIGENGRFVSIVRDIEERKQTEQALQDYAFALESVNNSVEQARAESEHATRAKSDFLANMSHELRTPMNSIIGFSRRLMKRLEGSISERDFDALETVDRNAKHLLALINDILDFSKIEAGHLELDVAQFDFRDAVKETLVSTSALFDAKPLKLATDLPTEPLKINGDHIRIRQIMTNLISNAVKYSHEGTITVSLTQTDLLVNDDRIPVAKFSVKDTGVGIKSEDIKRLFSKFTQLGEGTAGKVGGTGLGLAITAEFVRMHGGLIHVTSEYGQGSEFSVLLPLNDHDLSTLSTAKLACEPTHNSNNDDGESIVCEQGAS
ncbi:PAS domain S-box protein [bacterium AH-315-J04]|nr:PAS domain S-box protein [bacterium AH-315-J04]